MHLFDVSQSFMGGYAIVGGHMPLACGLALGDSTRGRTAWPYFLGDGAVNEGEFHEALNLAAVWKLPVLFICENNLYGMGTPFDQRQRLAEIYKRAEAYGIRSEQVDGMDVLGSAQARRCRAKRARAAKGRHSSRSDVLIASAATRWPTRSSIARRMRSSTGAARPDRAQARPSPQGISRSPMSTR